MASTFEEYLKQERAKTQRAVEIFLKQKVTYYKDLDSSFLTYLNNLEEYSLRGGKWHRPTLVRLAFDIFKDKNVKGDIVSGSAGLELLHRFILIHDDIFDGDLQRHEGPTLETVYTQELKRLAPPYPVAFFGKGMAMISGDLLHTFALEMVREAGFEDKITLQVLRGMHECLAVTAAGWRLETLLKQQPLVEVREEDVQKAMWLVSGQYSILWPLRIGQLFGGAAYGEWSRELEEYGKHIGMAFQIQDDILGIMGLPAKTGKPVGNDFREGKKTLLLLHAYQKSTAGEKQFLEDYLGKEVSDTLDRVQSIIARTGALEAAKEEIKKHLLNAQKALDSLKGNVLVIGQLRGLGTYLGNRDV